MVTDFEEYREATILINCRSRRYSRWNDYDLLLKAVPGIEKKYPKFYRAVKERSYINESSWPVWDQRKSLIRGQPELGTYDDETAKEKNWVPLFIAGRLQQILLEN